MSIMQRSLFRSEFKSKSNSRTASRSNSRPPSRGPGENDLLSEISFDNLDELISERLNVLLNDHESNSKSDNDVKAGDKVKFKLNSIPEIIKTLQKPLKEVNSSDRELLLTQLYHLVIKTPDFATIYPNEDDYENDLLFLFKEFQSIKSASSNEFLLLNRVITSFLIVNLDESAVLYSEDKTLNVLNLLEKRIKDETIPLGAKQNLIYSYSSIVLAINDDSGGFGVEANFEFLQDFLLHHLQDVNEDFNLVIAILYGFGSILTLLINNSTLNELLENLLDPTLFDILEESENLELLKPVAMLFGFAFENYNYSDDINEDLADYDENDDFDFPFTNRYQLVSRLEELYKNSSKKISKKDKKQGRSVFKDVLNTVNFYSDKKQRIKKLSSKKRANEINVDDELIDTEEEVLSHIKLSKSRSLAVKSWFAFFRLIQLKWVFASGIHNQLANNKQIGSIVRDKPTNSYSNNFNFDDDNDEEYGSLANEEQKRKTHKKKQKEIESKRMEKLAVALDQSGINGEDGI